MRADLHHGDCLSVLRGMAGESVDLAYLDPPFGTGRVQRQRTRDGSREFSFRDLWASHAEYAEFLFERLEEVRRVLRPSGSVFVHCDRTASHVVRAVLDGVFGEDAFRSEIIWHYRRWSNGDRGLLPAHQTIFFYSRSDAFKFNPVYEDYSPATNVDQILQRRTRNALGKSAYDRDEDGKVVSGGAKRGVPLGDVWDIPYLNPKARERVGYPTQKPVLLLERIVGLCTDPGDWVLDPFCGSGTTLVAAKLLGRNSIGIDLSAEAVELARRRLAEPFRSESGLLRNGRESYRTADDDALALLAGLDCVPVQRNRGIDALLREPLHGRPVPIRVQRRGESVLDAAEALHRAGRTRHAEVMVLVVTNAGGALELGLRLPPEIVAVEAPAAAIRDRLSQLCRTGV